MRTEDEPGRGLNQETLKIISDYSKLKQDSRMEFRIEANIVGPYVDELKIVYPNGIVGTEFIEDANNTEQY